MHKNIFSKIVKQIHCKRFPALLRGSVMSKKELIQSTLYLSSKIDSSGEKRLAFKRKSSDPIETGGKKPNMNYANAVAGHGRGRHGQNDGRSYRPSSQSRGKHFDESRRFSNDGGNFRDSRDTNDFHGPSTSNDSKSPCHQNPVKNSSGSDRAPEEKSGSKDNSEDKERELNPKLLPNLKPSEFHRIFFDVNDTSKPPKPYPFKYKDHGDSDKFVFMPWSSQSYMPSDSGHGKIPRWIKIENALSAPIPGVFELEEVILSYNQHYKGRWNFVSLHNYFDQMSDEEKDTFFVKTLPKMKEIALLLPRICTESLPILGQHSNMKISITQQQAACLLANAFFCTFPNRNVKVKGSKLPDINFSNLYSGSRTERKIEKLKCLINYFKRVTEKVPVGTLTYTRQSVREHDIPYWKDDRSHMSKLTVFEKGTIEDNGDNMLQADFANKYVGGGALGQGLVQEEIRFMLCPEMILSRLFTECLTDNEVLIMTGCERFSSYTGYSDSFKFVGDFFDQTERDSWGRRSTEVVAMDALVIRNFPEQFRYQQLTRELRKAYCAFSGKYKFAEFGINDPKLIDDLKLPPVCTGNWGCGAFGGDKQLKALIQLMAASLAKRDVQYYTFGDGELSNDLEFLYQTIVRERVTVRNAFGLITEYGDKFHSLPRDVTLFDYIFTSLNVKRPRREVMERQSSYKGPLNNEESSD